MNPQLEENSHVTRFYEKLSELYASWIMLEDQHYRNTQMGELEFGAVDGYKEWP